MPFLSTRRFFRILVAIAFLWSSDAFVVTSLPSSLLSPTSSRSTTLRAAPKRQQQSPPTPDEPVEPKKGGLFGAVGNFFEELDAFLDDAT